MAKTKEQIAAYQKDYYVANQDQLRDYSKRYRVANQDKIKADMKAYRVTSSAIKINRINNWKNSGVISEDFNKLYEYYIESDYCEECGVILVEGNLEGHRKCLDHCHYTGLFRNILCNKCNVGRRW
jgi:hypothetical protein